MNVAIPYSANFAARTIKTMKLTQEQIEALGQHARELARLANARHAANEAKRDLEFFLQTLQAHRIADDLDQQAKAKADPMIAKIRALELEHERLTAALAPVEAELPENHDVSIPAGKTAWNTDSHVANVYAKYGMALEKAKMANDLKAKKYDDPKPTPEPARFTLQRDLRGGVGLLVKVQVFHCVVCNSTVNDPDTNLCPPCREAYL